MEHLLISVLFIIFLIILFGIINERTLKISNDIALVLFSFALGIILRVLTMLDVFSMEDTFVNDIVNLNLEEFLMDGILCFMLFSGASGVSFKRFVKNIKPISLLALLTTVISSFIYGGLFYIVNWALGLQFSIWMCILLGCIVSPTDPIAATSILKKAGLSKHVSTVIEGESLFNDGTGVALFVCIKDIVNNTSNLSFPVLMAKELLGAIAIGLAISFVMFELLKRTNNPMFHILISIVDVVSAYLLCEHLGCSGVIASVVCGLYFSRSMSSVEEWRRVVDPKEWYEDFWHIIDTIFNSILFIFIGFAVINIPYHEYLIILVIIAVVLNFAARFLGVGISALIVGKDKIPNKYNIKEFTTLMTWSALKGGLSLALALSTREFLTTEVFNVVLIMTSITMYFTIVVQGLTTKNIFKIVEEWKASRM